MAFEYELPDVGEGVAEGEIVVWHVEPGDSVEEDQVLAEVETDKAVVDLPSPVDGTIVELHAEAGDVVAVGSVVVTIDVDGDVDAADADGELAEDADVDAATPAESAPAAESEPVDGEEPAVSEGRVFAPPNVRRLARELGVDIATVEGSGPSGRISEADVRAAAERASEPAAPAEDAETAEASGGEAAANTAATAAAETQSGTPETAETRPASTEAAAERERTLAAPATRKVARELGVDLDRVPTEKRRDGEAFVEPEDVRAFAEARGAGEVADASERPAATDSATGSQAAAAESPQPVTTEPYRGIRRTIGQQMDQSATTIPHATHHDTAVVDELVETRKDLKPKAEERGISLTYTPFVLKAVASALQEHPVMNTELDEEADEIRYKEYYNVGLATATDAGLMVPVVDAVDEKGLLQLASEANELVERARSREISPEEMRGGTFTVTNFGAIGGEYATPIINHPETGILGLGSIEQRPVVDDGEVVAAHTLPLSLSIDHRVIDGAEAAQFANTVIEYLENPRLLLL